MIGGSIGQYRVTRLIGKGGMGAVYAGEHTLLGRTAAIKVLLPELTQNQEIVNRFFNEARATTAIHHPGIVEIYDFGWNTDGSAYIVMELLRGEALSTRIARQRPTWSASLAILRQISGALAAAHAQNIVHRDLKPENIFLISDPEVPGGERIKLLDFGIAKLAGDAGNTSKTRTGSVMGTPTYMAPEQCRGVAVDSRADLYALGCILFELCAGRPPFVGEGSGDVLAAHIHVPPPTIASLAPGVPHEIELLTQHLLAKQPAQRLQTADEVIRAIDHMSGAAFRTGPQPMISTGVGATAPTTLSGAASSATSTTPPTSRSRGPLIAAIAIAALAAGALALVMTRRSGNDSDSVAAAADTRATEATSNTAASNATTSSAGSSTASASSTITPTPSGNTSGSSASTTAGASTNANTTNAGATNAGATNTAESTTASTVEASITSAPVGAEILLDGKLVGKTPWVGLVPRGDGEVSMVLRLSGHREKRIALTPTAPISQHVKLEPRARAKTNRDQSVNPFGN